MGRVHLGRRRQAVRRLCAAQHVQHAASHRTLPGHGTQGRLPGQPQRLAGLSQAGPPRKSATLQPGAGLPCTGNLKLRPRGQAPSPRQRGLPANDRSGLRLASTDHPTVGKEKLQIRAHIWYKVSRSERVSYNGITPASQADNEGSIPFTRSNRILLSRRDGLTRNIKNRH